ncbi:hypothetical protein [Catenulispora rubra]|uniref:hypothetical protein n=1 Tax=Catenulispora rubra TaxID=280293 RepID=UPI001891F4F8|nr:hypothetical protein [Catenulispora rubra]
MGGPYPQPTPVPGPTAVPTKPQPVTYAPEGGAGTPNPYATQTTVNTQFGWGGGSQPLSVDIHGLGDYAVDMKNIADFEHDHMQMQLLMDGITKAWPAGPVLPEAMWACEQFEHNVEEFTQYLQNLYNAVYNIGFAAQSIADCYSGTDGWSAADVNAVDYAFGDNVTRPAGWFAGDDKTWLQVQAANHQGDQGTAPPVWVSQTTTKSGNTTITVSTDKLGHTQTVKVTTNPDGSSVMVFTGIDGKTTTTTSQVQTVGNTQTTVTRENGEITGSTTVVTADRRAPGGDGVLHVVTTTKLDSGGKEVGRTVVTTYTGPEGPSTDIATYGADGTLLSEVATGAPTASAPGGRDSTVADADQQIDKDNYQLEHMPINSDYTAE